MIAMRDKWISWFGLWRAGELVKKKVKRPTNYQRCRYLVCGGLLERHAVATTRGGCKLLQQNTFTEGASQCPLKKFKCCLVTMTAYEGYKYKWTERILRTMQRLPLWTVTYLQNKCQHCHCMFRPITPTLAKRSLQIFLCVWRAFTSFHLGCLYNWVSWKEIFTCTSGCTVITCWDALQWFPNLRNQHFIHNRKWKHIKCLNWEYLFF